MASIQVFGLPACTDVSRVLACLFEKEVEFQLVRVDRYKDEHKVPESLRLQDPSGRVTYMDGSVALTDSRQICRRVCKKFADQGNRHLLGPGALERASIEQWLKAEEQSFQEPSSSLVFHLAFEPEMYPDRVRDEGKINGLKEKVAAVLDIYDKRLSSSEYLAGDDFTLADLSHLPNSYYLVTRSLEGRQLFKSRKHVMRWWNAIASRASWKKVIDMQGEHPGPLEK